MAAPKSAAQVAANMVAAMKVADPELDTSIGSVTRKIIDVVAEQIAPAYAQSYLRDWVNDVDSKSGSALDDFVAQFGFQRIPARRASGLVKFVRPTAAPGNIPIPLNTVVITSGAPTISFATYATAWVLKGTKEVTVPVQAIQAGASGNLPVGSITRLASQVSGVSATVVQADAITGGVDAESDEALRERFKNTVFRSLAGTKDMYLATALEDPTPDDDSDSVAIAANIIGPTSRWREQVQVGADGFLTSTLPAGSRKYVYTGTTVFGTDIENGEILTEGVHYNFVTSPVVRVEPIGDAIEEGTVYDLDFEYVSKASRNDPENGITNRIDIWVAGVAPQQASEVTYFQTEDFVLDSTEPLYFANFLRLMDDGLQFPLQGNKFLQLAWGPIVEFPQVLSINGEEFVRDEDFWVVYDWTAFGLSPRSRFGLEFKADTAPPPNSQIVLSGSTSYYYNRLPHDVQERAARWKLLTTDFLAHAAFEFRFIFNLAVMYHPNYERGVVQAGIDSALSNYINNFGFGNTMQVSDILQVAHNVPGVDNVRFLNSTERAIEDDENSYGIQIVTRGGTHINHVEWPITADPEVTKRVRDITFADYQIPVLHDARYVTKAQNTFGVM